MITGLTVCIAVCSGPAITGELVLGRFSDDDLSGWEAKSFEGDTSYRLVEQDGRTVLEATSDGTASGLILERKIDLTATPVLRWSWRIAAPVNPPDETNREGDDFAARIYFVTPGDGFLSFPDSIAYVWASNQPSGLSWPNPYTDKVQMYAVDSGVEYAGQWRHYRRNIREDFQALFGRDIVEITHIAIMTDTDNSGLSVQAWYGDISIARQSTANRFVR